MTIELDYQRRTEIALAKAMLRDRGIDLTGWPEEVRPIVLLVCLLWSLKPPDSKKSKDSKAYWIKMARELDDACGEFGLDVIRAYRTDFEQYMMTHGGLPPFSVEGPGALIKSVRAKAGQMRGRGQENGRDKYTTGEFAEFIEH